jgi:hypothetical protein
MNSLFKSKYSKYINYSHFLTLISEYRCKYNLKYNNLIQNGGNKIEKINKTLTSFKQYNIKLDALETEDKDVRIEFYTIDDKAICFSVLINQEEKIATIENLLFDRNCIPDLDAKKITSKLIKIIKEICRQAGIKKIELSDNSHYNCTGNYTLDLKHVNTLTSGEPYYYKYGFKFSNKDIHKDVKYNKEKLKGIKTSNLDIEKFLNLCKEKLKDIKVDKNTRKKTLEYIKETYEYYFDNNIKEFFNDIKYKICVLFSKITYDLYNILGLKMYTNKLMYINLK